MSPGAKKIIADLELMLGFPLFMSRVWWFVWVLIVPAFLMVRCMTQFVAFKPVTQTKTNTSFLQSVTFAVRISAAQSTTL